MELTATQAVVAFVAIIAGPGGAAWVAVKVALNGARQDIRDIKASVGRLGEQQTHTAIAVARLEERVGHMEDAA